MQKSFLESPRVLFDLVGVNYVYPDGTPAVSNVTFSVTKGTRLAILGANGSGKSTLLRLMNGLYFADSGEVQFEYTALSESTLSNPKFQADFRQRVGFVFQDADAQLFNATVFDEIAFAPRQLGLDEAEVQLRVNDVVHFLGISHLLERAPFRLSGGEKRKVAIGSVLSMNPEVLLLDEPILGLDPRSQEWLIRTLNALNQAGKTIIIATHNLPTLDQIADDALVISDNHTVLAQAPLTEIIQNLDLLREANLISSGAPVMNDLGNIDS